MDAFKETHQTAEFKEAWTAFVRHRKEKRKPITKQAFKLLRKRLEEVPVKNATEALWTSIECGWTGVFPKPPQGPSHLPATKQQDLFTSGSSNL